jgi:hypothetical protein
VWRQCRDISQGGAVDSAILESHCGNVLPGTLRQLIQAQVRRIEAVEGHCFRALMRSRRRQSGTFVDYIKRAADFERSVFARMGFFFFSSAMQRRRLQVVGALAPRVAWLNTCFNYIVLEIYIAVETPNKNITTVGARKIGELEVQTAPATFHVGAAIRKFYH